MPKLGEIANPEKVATVVYMREMGASFMQIAMKLHFTRQMAGKFYRKWKDHPDIARRVDAKLEDPNEAF